MRDLGAEHVLVEAKRLAHGPRLERAPARRVRRVAVRDLRHVAGCAPLVMAKQRDEEARSRFAARFVRATANAKPGVDECSDEPWLDGALVIRAVALAHVASVVADVARLARA